MNAFTNYATQQGYNTGMPNFQTMGYNPAQQPQAKPHMTNPLTDEQIKLLRQHEDAFDLKIRPEELAKAICTHKDPNTGTFATILNPDGSVTCKICHQTFRPNDVDEEFVKKAVEAIINTLQTCKMIGVDLNDDVIRQFFAIMPYLERVPKLYKLVNNIFNKYNQQSPVIPNSQGQNIMGMYNNVINPAIPVGGMPAYNMGMYGGYPYQGAPQQTAFQNMQNQMVNGGANPFYATPNPQAAGGYNPYATMQQQGWAPQEAVNPFAGQQQPPQGQQTAQGAPQQTADAGQQQPPQGQQTAQQNVTVSKPIQL